MWIKTSEAEIAEKIRTSSLGEKLGILIKKKGVDGIVNPTMKLKRVIKRHFESS